MKKRDRLLFYVQIHFQDKANLLIWMRALSLVLIATWKSPKKLLGIFATSLGSIYLFSTNTIEMAGIFLFCLAQSIFCSNTARLT